MRSIMFLLALLVPSLAYAAPVLNFHISRSPLLQGQPYAIFITNPEADSYPELALAAELDGVSVDLRQPANDLWVFSGLPLSAVRSHMLVLSLYENGVQIGTQAFTYIVAHNESNANFPRFESISPSVAAAGGGTTILVKGANFKEGARILIGGIPAVTSFIDSENLLAVTPSLEALSGLQPVEVTLPPLPGSEELPNVVADNAFYVTGSLEAPNPIPVAIVTGPSQSVVLGAVAQLNASASYSPGGHSLAYEWDYLAVPKGSRLLVGDTLQNVSQPNFTPDVAGLFVIRLLVRETGVSNPLTSHAQLTLVFVEPAALYSRWVP